MTFDLLGSPGASVAGRGTARFFALSRSRAVASLHKNDLSIFEVQASLHSPPADFGTWARDLLA